MSRYSREFRFNDNFDLMSFNLSERNEFPILEPEQYDANFDWIGYNYANAVAKNVFDLSHIGIHFYLDDYQFARVWTSLNAESLKLRRFGAILTPDFSMYCDWPMPQQKWSHYKAMFVGAYLQRQGMCVYPSINWSSSDSFDWCFEGLPTHSCVAVSSVGTQTNSNGRIGFKYGYDAMIERLQPNTVLFYGRIPDGCGGNIVQIETFVNQMKKRCTKESAEQ